MNHPTPTISLGGTDITNVVKPVHEYDERTDEQNSPLQPADGPFVGLGADVFPNACCRLLGNFFG
jgi:hypothetical protein